MPPKPGKADSKALEVRAAPETPLFQTPVDDQHEAGHGADDDGVDEGAHHADQPAATASVDLPGGLGDAGSAEARLVGEDAAGDAVAHGHHHGGAREAAGGRRPVKARSKISAKAPGIAAKLMREHDSAASDVGDAMKGTSHLAHRADALDPAEDHEAGHAPPAPRRSPGC